MDIFLKNIQNLDVIAVRKVKKQVFLEKVDNEEVIETIHAYEFIKKLIIHIPEKNFKMIRYFGIYFLLVDI